MYQPTMFGVLDGKECAQIFIRHFLPSHTNWDIATFLAFLSEVFYDGQFLELLDETLTESKKTMMYIIKRRKDMRIRSKYAL